MPNGTCEEISAALQAVIYAVLQREEALMCSCPKMGDKEHAVAMRDVASTDKKVVSALAKLRKITDRRLKDYLDSEVILTVFLMASIWHNARDLFVNSNRLGDIVGRHKPDELAELTLRLTTGSSPTLSFLSLRWSSRSEPAGQYQFRINKPKALSKLIFGNACLME